MTGEMLDPREEETYNNNRTYNREYHTEDFLSHCTPVIFVKGVSLDSFSFHDQLLEENKGNPFPAD